MNNNQYIFAEDHNGEIQKWIMDTDHHPLMYRVCLSNNQTIITHMAKELVHEEKGENYYARNINLGFSFGSSDSGEGDE